MACRFSFLFRGRWAGPLRAASHGRVAHLGDVLGFVVHVERGCSRCCGVALLDVRIYGARGNTSIHLGGLWLLRLGLGLGGWGGRALCSRAGLGWGCRRVLDLVLGLEGVGIGRQSV